MKPKKTPEKHAGGRPPKFRESCRPVTVTLPERILAALDSVSPDRSLALVKCVDALLQKGRPPAKAIELIELTPGKALIVVGPCSALRQIEWLRLIEIAPLRNILVLPSGTPVEVLEVALNDLLRALGPDDPERGMLAELQDIIGYQRRGRALSTAEILFVDIPKESKAGRTSGFPA
jgi:hypothetical protein